MLKIIAINLFFALLATSVTKGLLPTVLRLGALPGDAFLQGVYNHNGVVDAADYTRWRETRGQSTALPGSGADGNGNGVIDQED